MQTRLYCLLWYLNVSPVHQLPRWSNWPQRRHPPSPAPWTGISSTAAATTSPESPGIGRRASRTARAREVTWPSSSRPRSRYSRRAAQQIMLKLKFNWVNLLQKVFYKVEPLNPFQKVSTNLFILEIQIYTLKRAFFHTYPLVPIEDINL